MLNETLLASRYRLIRSLGKGAFGQTYLAEDTFLPGQPQCVVKKLNPQLENGDYLHLARRLFKQEAEALHKLGHWDKIPTLYAYFEEEAEFYLVQQYIPGNTLMRELVSGYIWSEAKVIQLLEEVLHILDFIHSHSVIHRDIKPSNLIRRSRDNKLVLVDFGAVKEVVVSQTSIASNLTIGIGTKGYMASEQIRGKPRYNSDIYALGIIGIQALTGLSPHNFTEDEAGEIIWQHRAKVSPQLAEIVSNMTRYHFQERYQSAQEVLSALKNELEPNSIKINRSDLIIDTSDFIDDEVDWDYQSFQDTTIKIKSGVQKTLELDKKPLEKALDRNKKSIKYVILIASILTGIITVPVIYTLNYNRSQKKQWVVRGLKLTDFTGIRREEYQKCLELNYVKKIQKQKGGLKAKEEIVAKCKLNLVEELAAAKDYVKAIQIILEVEKSGFYERWEIQEKIDIYSQKIFEQATNIYQQEGDLAKASNLIDLIPQRAEVQLQALEAATHWSIQNEISSNLLKEAKNALEAKQWQQAKNRGEEILKKSKSQKLRAEANKITTIAKEQLAREFLDRANQAISQKKWREAIALANEVKTNGNSENILEAEQIIKIASQKISEVEKIEVKPVFKCDLGIECSQLF